MHRLHLMRSRKLEAELSYKYRQRLQQLRNAARNERQQVPRNTINSSNAKDRTAPGSNPLQHESPTDFRDLGPHLPNGNPNNEVHPILGDNLLNPPDAHFHIDAMDPPDNLNEPIARNDTNEPNPPNDFNEPNALNEATARDPPNVSNVANAQHLPEALNGAGAPRNLNELNDTDVFKRNLTRAFLDTSMNHQQINSVLRVLHDHSCFSHLPLDARTILQTPRSATRMMDIAGGQYLHIGIEEGIRSILRRTAADCIPDRLLIDFSTDGATLDAQKKINMWPIQIRIANIADSKPEMVGIWQSTSKPTCVNEFFTPFVDDFLQVYHRGGVRFNGIIHPVEIRCFIADSPARAFSLAHLAHNSYHPCSKCWIRGVWVRQGVTIFPSVDDILRTAEEYANRIDGEHHSDVDTPLLRLPMNLVTQVVFEYMHCVCLGVMKKILCVLISGQYAPHLKLNAVLQQILNARLALVKKHCPCEFARKPDDITKFSSFKATELRQILLYTAPVVLHGLVKGNVYLHLLIFHTAIRILVNPSASRSDVLYAQGLLRIFVQRAEGIYGLEFLTYVVHCLLHLADDVLLFGPLDSFSAFPYENNMAMFRRDCRKNHQHLQQIVNRRAEESRVGHPTVIHRESVPVPGKPWKNMVPPTVSPNCRQYQTLKCKTFFISLNDKDDTLMLQDGRVCIVQNIILENNAFLLVVKTFHRADDFSSVECPLSASKLLLCSVLVDDLQVINMNQVQGKCFRMPYWHNNEFRDPIPDIYVVGLLTSSAEPTDDLDDAPGE